MNPNLKRLENIKSSFEIEVKEKTFDNATMVMMRERDIEWLFAYINELQSITADLQGKVDDLKEEIDDYEYHNGNAIGDLSDHALKYREVLSFYADRENYKKMKFEPLNPNAQSLKLSQIDLDWGEKARETLESIKKKCTCDYKNGEGCSDNCCR